MNEPAFTYDVFLSHSAKDKTVVRPHASLRVARHICRFPLSAQSFCLWLPAGHDVINRSRNFNNDRPYPDSIQPLPTSPIKCFCKIIGLTLSLSLPPRGVSKVHLLIVRM